MLHGRVADSATGAPLEGVRVTVTGGGRSLTATSAADGLFRIARLASGRYAVTFQRIGYRPAHLDSVVVSPNRAPLDVRLVAVGVPLDAIVVSASRTPETRLDAPASVTVVDRREIAEHPALTAVDHIATAPGVDAARKGLLQETYDVRGSGSVNSGALLTLTDYRYAEIPSLALNVPYLIPATDDDIERIELERGPGTALYGPNSSRGVLLVITRSPFDSRGASVSLTGGTRALFQGSARYAFTVGDRVGFKLSGQYVRGRDWPFTDSTEVARRDAALAGGANPDTLLIARRDSTLERGAAEARMDWRVGANTTAIVTAGFSEAFDLIDQTSAVGAVQGRNWRYSYLQARLRHDRVFFNAVYNESNAGDTYILRSGLRLVDRSRIAAAQLQDGARFGATDIVFGADGRWTDPRTEGTIDGRNEPNDQVTELGAYASTTTPLGSTLDLVAALRGDHHSVLNDLVISPRLGVVFKPAPTHAIRLMYNRAFTSPDANDLFIDIPEATFGIVPPYDYTVRVTAIPQSGFSFNRACGGPCMRSPFVGGGGYVRADALTTWPTLVRLLAAAKIVDLSGVPTPTDADISTRIATLDPTSGAFVPSTLSSVTDLPAPGRTISNTIELGYKGVVRGRAAVDIDVYLNRIDGVTGSPITITPNVFYDHATLEAYLARYLPAAQAKLIADTVARIPAGTISPVESGDPTDILVAQRKGGGYTYVGADVAVRIALSDAWSAHGSFSWVSRDSVPNIKDVGGVALNVPGEKGTLGVDFRDARTGLTVGVAGRAVASFPVLSGEYMGRVPAYAVVDATAGVPLPLHRGVRMQVTAYNLTDNRHQEFVGAPFIGRLLLMQLHAEF